MKVCFIGCVEFSRSLLETTMAAPGAELAGVVTRSRSPLNSDFVSLRPLAERAGVPCLSLDSNDQNAMEAFVESVSPDALFCFGWSYLLKAPLLQIPEMGAIGYHPAPLPQGRGRHPLIWTLVLGLRRTASTFFFMDDRADSGDILSQVEVPVHADDTASALYERLTHVARGQLREIIASLDRGEVQATPQDDGLATYWRKRTADDGRIDWRMSAEAIDNLVRALGSPYPGAHFVTGGEEIKVWEVTRVHCDTEAFLIHEPGKVLDVGDAAIDVRCGDGIVRILRWEGSLHLGPGDYL